MPLTLRIMLLAALAMAACKRSPQGPVAPSGPTPECGSAMGNSSPLRLLTRTEFNQTVRDLLGDTSQPALDFPREPLAFGFDNNADLVKVTPDSVARYLDAAESLAATAVKTRRAQLVTCPNGVEDAACGQSFVRDFGHRVFRRALTPGEETSFSAFFSRALDSEQSFDGALEVTLQLMLQSPQFLYRVEPSSSPKPGLRALTGDELASRLSYFLWGSMPDEALLAAASTGELSTVEGLQAQAERLLADPRAHDAESHFFSQWLSLDAVDTLAKDPSMYPDFDGALARSLRGSLQRYADEAFFGEGTLKALLTTDAVYVDQRLAQHYGLPPPSIHDFNADPLATVTGPSPSVLTAPGADFGKATDPTGHRQGLLMQPGLLAQLASPDQSSPVRRGLFVVSKLMCIAIPPPPPNVNAVPPGLNPGKTTRERFSAHSTDPACASCHSRMDPIGFGFEHFDGQGAWRDTENGIMVDASGEIIAATDQSLLGPFSTLPELSERLASSKQVHDCMAVQWLRYALGRVESPSDTCALQKIEQRFFDSGGRFSELQLAIVASDSFRYRAEPGVAAP